MPQLGATLKVIRCRAKEIGEEKRGRRESRASNEEIRLYIASLTEQRVKLRAKEKPVLKYGGFNPRGPLEQFHRVISFVATCDELTRICLPSFPLAALRSCAISAAN